MILAGFAALTLPLMPAQLFFIKFWPGMARVLPMHYHRLVLRLIGVRLKLVGRMPESGPTLVVSNHVGWMDIVILSALAPLSFVAKREVAGWPFFGLLAKLQRTVFVHRDRRNRTGQSRDEMQARLRGGDTLVLFPEGTSSAGTSVLPFKSSFFGAAELAHVIIQPLTIAYSGHRNLPMTWRLRPFYAWYGDMDMAAHLWAALAMGPIEVTIICHPVLSLSGETNRKALTRHAESLVRSGLQEALRGRGAKIP